MSADSRTRRNTWSECRVPRREALRIAGALLLSSLPYPVPGQTKRAKKIIVAGAGIAGLSCAYELVRRGHQVTVLEASGHTGGHVQTVWEGLADGLYADGGAEHFTQPGMSVTGSTCANSI